MDKLKEYRNLSKIIKREGFYKEGFAKKMGKTTQTLRNWQRGKTNPTFAEEIYMCDLLNCTVDELTENIHEA